MGRRRKSSPAEDLIALLARLPWWAGVVLATLAYVWLHSVAAQPAPIATTGAGVVGAVPAIVWRAFASVGQYLLPVLCLLGALVSVLQRRKRAALFDTAASADSAAALLNMSWQEFELLVGEGFKRRGYRVQELGGGGPDGGVDLVLTKGSEKSFVQCKQWKAFKVGVSTVRELYGVMAAHGAASGFVVTSGHFTREAQAFADGRNIQLIDGAALMGLLQDARGPEAARSPARQPRNAPESAALGEPISAKSSPAACPAKEPACPNCRKPMVERVAKRGANPGKAFWGCSNYAGGCQGTREI
jgi:restriction system protein